MFPVAKLRAATGYAARRLIWRLARRHSPSGAPPVFVFTSRRSGGSWLTDALSAEPGLLCVLQPFAIGLSDPFLRRGREYPSSLIANHRVPIRPDDEPWMGPFFDRILSGELRIAWPADPFSARFQARTDRVLVKLHNAKAWIDWLGDRFPEAKVVLHLRHPIPQALSAMRMNWPVRTEAYLRDRVFVDRRLTGPVESEIERLARSGSPFEKYLLNWFVENLAPLRLLDNGFPPNWLITTYEEAVLNPAAVFGALADHLELSRADAVRARARRPSHTVFDSRKARRIRQAAAPADRERLISAWQTRIDPALLSQAERLFQLFEVDAYRADSPLPRRELRLSADSFG